MPIELQRFNSRSFQSLAQALAVYYFGPGLQVYGSGADGSRDATFEGTPNYPSSTNPWIGYSVIQVKFREQPTEDHRDADWLVAAIKSEAKKFAATARNLRKPDFYLIITNVKLSGIEGDRESSNKKKRRGGLNKIDAALREFADAAGCTECHVWHRAKLETLIEAAPTEIRKTYAAWITPSDLIWEVLKKFEAPQFATVLARAMAQNMRENRCTRLQEAGHSDAEGTLLTQVFVDLPFIEHDIEVVNDTDHLIDLLSEDDLEEDADNSEDGDYEPEPETTPPKLAAALFDFAANRMCEGITSEPRKSGRIVLLGGPGQGKSTIGQFIIQFYEAMFLLAPGAPGVASETRSAAAKVIETASLEGISEKTPFRVPVRLLLPIYADRCAEAKKTHKRISLLDQIVTQLSDNANTPVQIEDARAWLKQHPWIIVLDGLDEVPPSGERDTILLEIQALFDEVAAQEADVLVIVTTRQQGYNHDLSPKLWSHWELTPLPPINALHYSTRLATVRLFDNEKRARVIKRLTEASRNPSTAQLMSSPLQVAILFTLVDIKGDVPTDRWSLFERYFSVLRDREEGKGGQYGDMLKRHRTTIEVIHHLAGFILQLAAEKSGRADSFLTDRQFQYLVGSYLSSEEHEGAELTALTKGLTKLATERLVLLASRVQDRIAFDVRSLQEFMAAAMITADRDELVQERLRMVAGKAHWRHVIQIAASRCFADTGKRHLADFIGTLCAELDASPAESGDRIAKSGSLLALDLLADGLGSESPKHKRILFDRALNILDLGPSFYDRRLAQVVDLSLHAHASEAIRRRATSASPSGWSAWKMLTDLVTLNASSFASLADDLRSVPSLDLLEVFDHLEVEQSDKNPFIQWVRDAAVKRGFFDVLATNKYFSHLERLAPFVFSTPHYSRNRIQLRFPAARTGLGFAINRIVENQLRAQPSRELPGKKWLPIARLQEYSLTPNNSNLSNFLESLKSLDRGNLARITGYQQSWPVVAILKMAIQGSDLQSLSERCANGDFADTNDWISAENRWSDKGVVISDLEYAAEIGQLFDKDVARIGLPPGLSRIPTPRGRRTENAAQAEILANFAKKAKSESVALEFRRASGLLIAGTAGNFSSSQGVIQYLIEKGTPVFARIALYDIVDGQRSIKTEDIRSIDLLGRALSKADVEIFTHGFRPSFTDVINENFPCLVAAFRANTSLRGLIPVILQSGLRCGFDAIDWSPSDEKLFEKQITDSEGTALSANCMRAILAVRLDLGITEHIEGIFSQLEGIADISFGSKIFSQIFRSARNNRVLRDAISDIVGAVVGKDVAEPAIIELRKVLDRRFSEFDAGENWHRYGFPLFLNGILKELQNTGAHDFG